jgi:hypothetical protein
VVAYFNVLLKGFPLELKMTRDNYIQNINKKSFLSDGNPYSNSIYEKLISNALLNFDLSMLYFESLCINEFKDAITSFIHTFTSFKSVNDLNNYQNNSGYYLMVLDRYKQAYIGTSGNIKIRILTHWSKKMPIDRLVFGNPMNSIMSINSFKAFDTTRIYALVDDEKFVHEDSLMRFIPEKFMCNRTIGGEIGGGIDEATEKGKTRDLSIFLHD